MPQGGVFSVVRWADFFVFVLAHLPKRSNVASGPGYTQIPDQRCWVKLRPNPMVLPHLNKRQTADESAAPLAVYLLSFATLVFLDEVADHLELLVLMN